MQSFEHIRAHVSTRYSLSTNDPYLLSFDLPLIHGRHQGIYLTELEDEENHKYLRISTPIGPLAGIGAERCLRFNWEQRTGFLAISDLEDLPYLHLCENRPYGLLSVEEIDRVVSEIGHLGDRLEQALSTQGDVY